MRRTSSLAHLGLTSLPEGHKHVETTKESSKARGRVLVWPHDGQEQELLQQPHPEGQGVGNNKVVTKSYKVCDGDVVEFEVEEKAISSVEAEEIP